MNSRAGIHKKICKQLEEEIDEPIDMSMHIMKPLCTQWLVIIFEYILSSL